VLYGLALVEGRALVNLVVTYQITATPWITGLYRLTDHMAAVLWHLDVGLSVAVH